MFVKKSFFIESAHDITYAAELLLSGSILLLKCGGAYAFFLNPNTEDLAVKLDRLKNRESNQYFSLACSYNYTVGIADHERINPDFYDIVKLLQGKAMFRFPLNTKNSVPFPYNQEECSIQCYNFLPLQAHNNVFRMELERLGCPFTLVTSANLHGNPPCTSFDDAEELTEILNEKAHSLGMDDVSFTAVYFPSVNGEFNYKGSFPIINFSNNEVVEVVRLINKDMAFTKDFFTKELKNISLKTSIAFPQ